MIDLVDLRRRLHQHPEVGLHLPRTRETVLDALAPLGLPLHTSESCSSVVVVIAGRGRGPTVLLRADMDALPVAEPPGLDFASTNGSMHACGHDLHTAALVGAIHQLHARRHEFYGDVLALFQPGEEGAGGAALMLSEQVLLTTGSPPVASFGAHVLSYLDSGTFSCRAGAVLAATTNSELTICGRGGHAARPHAALDPITTAAMIVQGVQTFVAQHSAPDAPIVATVGSLHAGTAGNVIPDTAVLGLSVRATSLTAVRDAHRRIAAMATDIAHAHGVRLDAEPGPELGPTVSDSDDAELVCRTVTDLFGPARSRAPSQPEMIAEDFSLFLEQTGGAFVLVGAAIDSGSEAPTTNHSPAVRFDDSVVPDIARLLAELAVSRLAIAGPSTTSPTT